MKTKLTALLMAMLFLLSTPAFALSDIDDHWANTQILTLVHFGYVSGYPDGTFQPDKNITRAEAVTILGHMVEDGGYDDEPIPFTDIDGSWAKQNIEKLQAFGIVSGYEDGTFRPQNTITRAEFSVMYYHVMLWNEELELGGPDHEMAFTDLYDFDGWMMEAVHALQYINYISGYPDGSFRPNGHITRAEVAAIIAKRHLSDSEDPDPVDPDPNTFKEFGDMPDADRQKIDALLLALGADDNYEVVALIEGGYTVFLPNFAELVDVLYDPGDADPFTVLLHDKILFKADGHRFGDFFIRPAQKDEILEWVMAYINEQGIPDDMGYHISATYRHEFETDTIDANQYEIYLDFDHAFYTLIYSTDGTLIDVHVVSE